MKKADHQTPISRIAIWFVASRLLVLIVAALAVAYAPKGRYGMGFDAVGQFIPYDSAPIDWFNHWDSMWYLTIAQTGYFYDPLRQSNVAFFPLYPLLMHLVGFVVPDVRIAGYLLSNAFLFGSCIFFWKLVRREFDSESLANNSVLLFLLCPVTVYYSSIYTESIFVFLTLAVAYFALGHRWLAAGVFALLAGLSRPPGILLSVLIGAEYIFSLYLSRKNEGRRAFDWSEALRVLVAMALPEVGLGMYMIYLHLQFNDALAFAHTQVHWNHHFLGLGGSQNQVDWKSHNLYINFLAIAVGIVLLVMGFIFRARPSLLILSVAFILLYCSTGLALSLPRYLSVVFPLYIFAALLMQKFPGPRPLVFLGSSLLAAFGVFLFTNGYACP